MENVTTPAPAQAPAKPATVPEKPATPVTQAEKRFLKAKVDGKEMDVPEEEAIAAWQKKSSSEQRFQEAAKLRKESEQFIQTLKQAAVNPKVMEQLLKHPAIGGDFKKIAEQYLYEIIQRESMSPEQKELYEIKEKLALQEERAKQLEEEQKNAQMSQLEQQYTADYQKDIITTLEQAGLPKSESTVGRMARYMYMGLQRGVELKASDVVDMVKQDYVNDIKSLFGSLPPEQMIGMLGEDLAEKIRKHDLAKLKGGINGQQSGPTNSQPEIKPKSKFQKKKSMTMDEFKQLVKQRAES